MKGGEGIKEKLMHVEDLLKEIIMTIEEIEVGPMTVTIEEETIDEQVV
jgi:hypothetical protein